MRHSLVVATDCLIVEWAVPGSARRAPGSKAWHWQGKM